MSFPARQRNPRYVISSAVRDRALHLVSGQPASSPGQGREIARCVRNGRGDLRVCVRARFCCHSEKFPRASGPPEEMKIAHKVTPAKAGAHVALMDSRLRGNDVFERDFQESRRRRGKSPCVENTQSGILPLALLGSE